MLDCNLVKENQLPDTALEKKKAVGETLQKWSIAKEGDCVGSKLHCHKQWGAGWRRLFQEPDMAMLGREGGGVSLGAS